MKNLWNAFNKTILLSIFETQYDSHFERLSSDDGCAQFMFKLLNKFHKS